PLPGGDLKPYPHVLPPEPSAPCPPLAGALYWPGAVTPSRSSPSSSYRERAMTSTAGLRARSRPALEPLEDRLVPAVLPAGFSEVPVATGLSSPTAMEIAPGGDLFVAEKGGTLKVFHNGTLLQSNFFQNTPLTVDS